MKGPYLLLFIPLIAPHFETMSQSIPALILPHENTESVKLDISEISTPINEDTFQEFLAVFVKNVTEDYRSNSIQGKYQLKGSLLEFKPFFPFEDGLEYVVRTKSDAKKMDFEYTTFLNDSRKPVAATKVLNIYPLSSELPENLLRFYIYFNTPMKKGEALRHISLRDAEGKIDLQAFMEFKQELWSSDGKRLTLLFDPGRIKRGVSTNLELGPALLEGKQYELIISSDWPDVYGNKLSQDITKTFRVVKPYRRQLKLDSLQLSVPKVKTTGPLILHFDRIIDHALIQSMLRVENENNQIISGYWRVLPDEKSAEFIAEEEWKQGNFQIIFNPRFEDVSGNNLEELLDSEALRTGKESKTTTSIGFTL
jgi:hypothetical protein